jgi:hypothetical protein
MNLLQNTPISCRVCNAVSYGRESPIRQNDGSLVMECQWRCNRCGTYLKRGITKIIEKPKNENK